MLSATPWRMHWKALAVAAVALRAIPAVCQIVEVKGGISSLSQTEGGTLTMRGQSYSGSIGAGTISGHIFGGAQVAKRTENATFTLGTDTLPFSLPTDIFDGNHYLTGVGGGVTARLGQSHLRAFLGETSTQFDSPFFLGTRGGEKAALISLTTAVNSRLVESFNSIFSNKVTLINTLAWNPGAGSKLAISGGVGSSQPYGAASVWMVRPRLELKAAYYAAGSQFRRADVRTPLSSEADRENVLVTLHLNPQLTFTAGRQNYLSPIYNSTMNIRSTVDQVSGTFEAGGYILSGTLLRSTYSANANSSAIVSMGKQFGPRLSVQETVLASRPDRSNGSVAVVTNLQETLTPRWSLSQVVNSSNGNNTVGFGGSFLSNFATLSAEYQTYYVPSRPGSPFEQALIANARVHVLSRVTLYGSTFVSPTGRLLYTVSAEGAISRQAAQAANDSEHRTWGRATLRGRVVDTEGVPIMGAVLVFDEMRVYTDSDGYFYVREQKSRWHGVKVLTEAFLDGYAYRVVSAPVTIRTSLSETQNDASVVVEKVATNKR